MMLVSVLLASLFPHAASAASPAVVASFKRIFIAIPLIVGRATALDAPAGSYG
jgi:hypothetical protein